MGDVFLVANVKSPALLKVSSVEASRLLQERIGVNAAPVVVARDMNRAEFLSTALTAMSLGLNSMMLAWGDRYPKSVRSTNVRDFSSLSEAIRAVAEIRRRAGSAIHLLAPVDLTRLESDEGVVKAKRRLTSGVDYLLAQPPTTNTGPTFEKHLALLDSSGLRGKVLLGVFPFRSMKDLSECEKNFGWRLPQALHRAAAGGERPLLRIAREVVRAVRKAGLPGVYVSTRGRPSVAERLLS